MGRFKAPVAHPWLTQLCLGGAAPGASREPTPVPLRNPLERRPAPRGTVTQGPCLPFSCTQGCLSLSWPW